MRRNISRLLFSADGESQFSFLDIENPPDRPLTRRQRFRPHFSLPRTPLPLLTTWCSDLLSIVSRRSVILFKSPTTWQSVFYSVVMLFLGCLIYSVGSKLSSALFAAVILFTIYIFFKTTPRTDLLLSGNTDGSVFLDINEPSVGGISRIDGLGVESFDDGTVYAGELNNGVRTGRGLIKIPGKCTYGGDWVGGGSDGYGIENIMGYGMYKGQFLRGMRTGYGRMQFSNGDEYVGQWLNGERDGMGRQTCYDGSFYEGQFEQGMKQGYGVLHYRFDFSFFFFFFFILSLLNWV